jgi:transcriptional regulator with XRE-family HTH domain
MEREPKTVGERIRKLRLARKLTQEQLAKVLGIKQGSVTQLETGKSKSPKSSTLTKAARYFEVDPEWLMTGKGPQQPVASLDPVEAELIAFYRDLSPEGQAYVFGSAKSVHQTERTRDPQRRREDRPPNTPKSGH